jgi:hypothetical protein
VILIRAEKAKKTELVLSFPFASHHKVSERRPPPARRRQIRIVNLADGIGNRQRKRKAANAENQRSNTPGFADKRGKSLCGDGQIEFNNLQTNPSPLRFGFGRWRSMTLRNCLRF